MGNFSFLNYDFGGLVRRLHKRYLDEHGLDPHPEECWNLPRVNTISIIIESFPSDKVKFNKNTFILNIIKDLFFTNLSSLSFL